jgi:hypothetical protein
MAVVGGCQRSIIIDSIWVTTEEGTMSSEDEAAAAV